MWQACARLAGHLRLRNTTSTCPEHGRKAEHVRGREKRPRKQRTSQGGRWERSIAWRTRNRAKAKALLLLLLPTLPPPRPPLLLLLSSSSSPRPLRRSKRARSASATPTPPTWLFCLRGARISRSCTRGPWRSAAARGERRGTVTAETAKTLQLLLLLLLLLLLRPSSSTSTPPAAISRRPSASPAGRLS